MANVDPKPNVDQAPDTSEYQSGYYKGNDLVSIGQDVSSPSQRSDESSDSKGRAPTGSTITEVGAIEEGGRTYHRYHEGKYVLPNDGEEQDRLDFQHQMWKLILRGRLHVAPVSEPTKVLDAATGTGIWAIEFAQERTNAQVVGTDLSQIQPPFERHGLENLTWVQEDAEESDWEYDTPSGRISKFDFVHVRLAVLAWRNPLGFIQKVFEHLEPGGYIEFHESDATPLCDDGTLEKSSGTLRTLWDILTAAASKTGIDARSPHRYKNLLAEAGFVDIVEHKLKLPGSAWTEDKETRRIGQYYQANILAAMGEGDDGGIVRKLLYDRPQEEVTAMARSVKADMRDSSIHWYWTAIVVYGRKPRAGEVVADQPATSET